MLIGWPPESSVGKYIYKKLPTPSKPSKIAKKSAAAAMSTGMEAFKPLKKETTPPKESAKAKPPTPKKAAKAPAPPVEDEEDSDDDTALKEHSAGQVDRLLRRHSKKWMMEGLAEAKDTDYESLTKKQVAERFIELLNGDTDDEGEE